MKHIKTFEAFMNEKSEGSEKKVAQVTFEEDKTVVECDGKTVEIGEEANEEEEMNLNQKIGEAAKSLGATHVVIEGEEHEVNEIIGRIRKAAKAVRGAIKRAGEKGLFKKQASHKSIRGWTTHHD